MNKISRLVFTDSNYECVNRWLILNSTEIRIINK